MPAAALVLIGLEPARPRGKGLRVRPSLGPQLGIGDWTFLVESDQMHAGVKGVCAVLGK